MFASLPACVSILGNVLCARCYLSLTLNCFVLTYCSQSCFQMYFSVLHTQIDISFRCVTYIFAYNPQA
ncbi:hypothetical protein BDV93DRAFT_238111 [Ceratobasidium sp. AG-I]|nr:hypothetical protein BDV93DRAFT_238111 [Ceratobasidium sp. AG-I]